LTVTHHNKTKLGWCCPSSTMAVVIKIEMCNHWMVHYRLYISTTDSNYKISAKGHYVKLLRTKLYMLYRVHPAMCRIRTHNISSDRYWLHDPDVHSWWRGELRHIVLIEEHSNQVLLYYVTWFLSRIFSTITTITLYHTAIKA
jgi:hypothetical protein